MKYQEDNFAKVLRRKNVFAFLNNRLFYSCLPSDLALDWTRGWGEHVLIQTSVVFICRSCCCYAN